MTDLIPVVTVEKENCVNCHMCISVCPVKVCIDGSKDYVEIDHNLCIGCGSCIAVCTHDARHSNDDLHPFLDACANGEKIFAIAAPAIVANFPDNYKNVFGWLKSLGVSAFFDVSFGAELTVKSYLNFAESEKPEMIISQPCPAIVTYIVIYQPELLPHLAPADSPMIHTVKMVHEFFPQYKDYKALVLSPCLAKKREFKETGYGDYNVTYKFIQNYINDKSIKLNSYPEVDFSSPSAERAVLFSSPGGLIRTVERDNPEIVKKSRKIEGPGIIYEYLKHLPEMLEKGMNPVLIDCLNCEMGCNGGPGTLNQEKSVDEIEYFIEKRKKEVQERYHVEHSSNKKAHSKIDPLLKKFWKPGLYSRSYINCSSNNQLKVPDKKALELIYHDMHKYEPKDHLNCASCGYNSCENMATAIYNNLNKASNCHHFRQTVIVNERNSVTTHYEEIHSEIKTVDSLLKSIRNSVAEVSSSVQNQSASVNNYSLSIEQMITSLKNLSAVSEEKEKIIEDLVLDAKTGETDMEETVSAIRGITTSINSIGEMISLINDVADKTNLLSMNAAIEAAHAGCLLQNGIPHYCNFSVGNTIGNKNIFLLPILVTKSL